MFIRNLAAIIVVFANETVALIRDDGDVLDNKKITEESDERR